jgi:hypothetical protein
MLLTDRFTLEKQTSNDQYRTLHATLHPASADAGSHMAWTCFVKHSVHDSDPCFDTLGQANIYVNAMIDEVDFHSLGR